MTTPTPGPSTPTTPVKTGPMEEEVQQLVAMADLGMSGFIEMPVMIKLGPHHYQYRCFSKFHRKSVVVSMMVMGNFEAVQS